MLESITGFKKEIRWSPSPQVRWAPNRLSRDNQRSNQRQNSSPKFGLRRESKAAELIRSFLLGSRSWERFSTVIARLLG